MKITCALFLLGCLCHPILSHIVSQYWFIEHKENWYGALRGCRAQGMNLVSPHSKDENDVIVGQEKLDEDGYWTSGNNMGARGTYQWIGNGMSVEYENWDPQLPGDPMGIPACIAFLTNGTWTRSNCFNMKKYICERPYSKGLRMSS